MTRFLAFSTRPGAGISRSALRRAAQLFSGRAALTALCFFVIATAGMRQMDASYRQSIVMEGRYSLVETGARAWRAQDLRVGWTKNGAFISLGDYAVLRLLALGGFTLSALALMTPAAWLTLQALAQRSAEDESDERSDALIPAE